MLGLIGVTAISAPARARAGELVYKGCISGKTGNGPAGAGACAQIPSATRYGTGSGLGYPRSVVVSSDGRSLYTASGASCGRAYCNDDAAVAGFRRSPTTGALHYRRCITGATETAGSVEVACTQIPSASPLAYNSGLNPVSLAASTDGKSLYTASLYCGPLDECYGDDAVARFDRNPTTSALAYEGCITGDTRNGPSGSGACAEISSASEWAYHSGLQFPKSVVLSDDGKSLYVAGSSDDAIARFDRDPSTGALTYQGCITGLTDVGPAGSGACTLIPGASQSGDPSGLSYPHSLAMSPGGRWLYVAIYSGVTRLHRNPSTGALTYRDCITGATEFGPSGSGTCRQIPGAGPHGSASGLAGISSLVVTADGRSLYGTSIRGLVRFDRDRDTGAVAYKGCITGNASSGPAGSGVCAAIPGATPAGRLSGFNPGSLAVSADGKSLYATTSSGGDSLARLHRNTTTGALTYRGCVSGDAALGPSGSGACAEIPSATSDGSGSGLGGPVSVALSADDNSIYVASSSDSAVARFALAPQTRITASPQHRTRSHLASFRFHSDDSRSTFKCKLDRRRFKPCDSPRTYRHLADGRHTFKVRATDSAHNTDPTAAKRRWVVL